MYIQKINLDSTLTLVCLIAHFRNLHAAAVVGVWQRRRGLWRRRGQGDGVGTVDSMSAGRSTRRKGASWLPPAFGQPSVWVYGMTACWLYGCLFLLIILSRLGVSVQKGDAVLSLCFCWLSDALSSQVFEIAWSLWSVLFEFAWQISQIIWNICETWGMARSYERYLEPLWYIKGRVRCCGNSLKGLEQRGNVFSIVSHFFHR